LRVQTPSSPGAGAGFREETNSETAMRAQKDEGFGEKEGTSAR